MLVSKIASLGDGSFNCEDTFDEGLQLPNNNNTDITIIGKSFSPKLNIFIVVDSIHVNISISYRTVRFFEIKDQSVLALASEQSSITRDHFSTFE